jgi:RNA polymerase sigma-70 factor (ECF subfamily)
MSPAPSPVSSDDLKQARPEAVQSWVHQDLPRLFELCFFLTDDEAKAEALCRAAFIETWNKLDSVSPRSTPFQTLSRAAIGEWKKSLRRRRGEVDVSANSGANATNHRSTPELNLSGVAFQSSPKDAQKDRRLHRYVMELEPDDHVLICLRDTLRLSYEDLSDILDLSQGGVKSALTRAREHLRNRVRSEEGDR